MSDRTHAQILADIAADVRRQHRTLSDVVTDGLSKPGAKWTPETGWTDEPIVTDDWNFRLRPEYQG